MSLCRLASLIAILACGFLAASPGVSLATNAQDLNVPSARFVQKLGDKALTSLTARDLPASVRSERVRALLRENFDIQTIGRFVLGPHWSEATDSQRREYFRLFEEMIVQTYTQRFANYSGQSFKVTSIELPGEESQDSIISSLIVQQNDGAPLNVDWHVRRKNGQMKIVDVLVDNISMSLMQRSDFETIIERGGGKVDALLTALREHARMSQ